MLWGRPLTIPAARPEANGPAVETLVKVRIDCPELCLRYTARVVRGVKIGPSPKWMARRLEAIGITPINNVVDISNYVLMECGQPLHTFDFAKLAGRARSSSASRKPGETIEAIDHKTYRLEPGMCVIADARYPVAIGGVMGGAEHRNLAAHHATSSSRPPSSIPSRSATPPERSTCTAIRPTVSSAGSIRRASTGRAGGAAS